MMGRQVNFFLMAAEDHWESHFHDSRKAAKHLIRVPLYITITISASGGLLGMVAPGYPQAPKHFPPKRSTYSSEICRLRIRTRQACSTAEVMMYASSRVAPAAKVP
jgi:hypothetical protein